MNLNINIPTDIYDQIIPICKERGLSLEEVIEVQLTKMANAAEKFKPIGLLDIMPFGQYKGNLVEILVRADPRYIKWVSETSETITFTDGVLTLMDSILNPPKQIEVPPKRKRKGKDK